MQEDIGAAATKLNGSRLKVGDIVLTTTTAPVSKVIRIATHSDISHAMVCVESSSVIDATSEGVQARNIQRMFFEPGCAVHVLRLRETMSTEQLAAVKNFLRGRIGTQYSKKEAIQTVMGGGQEWTKKQFCSRLVAQAFAVAGIALVGDPNFCSPASLKDSQLLIAVANATLPVTPEEASLWEGIEDMPQMMRDAINTVLDGARLMDPGTQTFDDLHSHLIAHPEADDELCRVLEASGYLSIWQREKAKNRWQYDYDMMAQLPAPQVEEYCRSVLADERAGPNRYVVNRGGYALFARESKLHFFATMFNLYDHLATLHRSRVDVASKWLELNGRLVLAATPVLRPHTTEWFAALELWDPAQAAMTRLAIEVAGSAAICSICADDPTRDYRLVESGRPAYGVDTLRLCDDCLKIRAGMGERFSLLPGLDMQ
jgi:hypothetical protein